MQTDLMSMLDDTEPAPAPAVREERHGPADRLFDAPKTIAGQLAMGTDRTACPTCDGLGTMNAPCRDLCNYCGGFGKVDAA